MSHQLTLHRRDWLRFSAAGLIAALGQQRSNAEPFTVPAKPVTRGPKHHFFGYYDKCPWNATGRFLLAHEIDFCDRQPKAGEAITLGLVDRKNGDQFQPFDTTLAWCWQQGAMLQWNPAAADQEVIYNSVADGKYVTIIRNIDSGKTRTLPMPVHFVRPDGKEAITLDYDRLHRLRPGYGYVALPERLANDPAPDSMGAYTVDLKSGMTRLLVTLAQLAKYKSDARMTNAHHYLNHMQYSPSGNKFLFLHRWTKPGDGRFSTRLFVVNRNGSDLRLIMDTTLFSHFDWRDDDVILAWTRSKEHGAAFHLIDLKADTVSVFGTGILAEDGHCSYSPDRKWVLNDTYPNKERKQTLMLIRVADGRRFDLGQFLSPPMFKGPIRCDLHPRFNRAGTQVCFDSTHEGDLRQVYVVDVAEITRST